MLVIKNPNPVVFNACPGVGQSAEERWRDESYNRAVCRCPECQHVVPVKPSSDPGDGYPYPLVGDHWHVPDSKELQDNTGLVLVKRAAQLSMASGVAFEQCVNDLFGIEVYPFTGRDLTAIIHQTEQNKISDAKIALRWMRETQDNRQRGELKLDNVSGLMFAGVISTLTDLIQQAEHFTWERGQFNALLGELVAVLEVDPEAQDPETDLWRLVTVARFFYDPGYIAPARD